MTLLSSIFVLNIISPSKQTFRGSKVRKSTKSLKAVVPTLDNFAALTISYELLRVCREKIGCGLFTAPFIGRISTVKKQESFNLALHSANACLNYRFTTIALRSAPCSVRLIPGSSFTQVFMYVCKAVMSLSTQFGWCAPGSFHHQAPASRVYPPALITILLLSFALHLNFTLSSVSNTSRSQFVLFVPSLLHP